MLTRLKPFAATAAAVLSFTLLPTALPTAASAAEEPTDKAATDTLSVDFAKAEGEFNHTGAGMHYGLSEDGTLPSDDLVEPLKLNLLRGGGAQLEGLDGSPNWGWLGDGYKAGPGFERRMNFVVNNVKRFTSPPINGRYALLLNDLWGFDALQGPGHKAPCDRSEATGEFDCSNYVEFLNTIIDRVQEENLDIYYWDVQNEPENGDFWPRGLNTEQYFKMWDTAYRTIKARLPDAKIGGPSHAYFNEERLAPFLDHTKAAGTVPDILVWHGLNHVDPAMQADATRRMLAERDIPEMPFSINEYNPGDTAAYYLSRLNEGRVESAARGIWGHRLDDLSGHTDREPFCCTKPNLAGMIPIGKPEMKTDQWWTYATYGQMSGTRYDVTHGSRIAGTATADAGKKQAMVLMGGDNSGFRGDAKVTINGLNAQPWLTDGGKVDVKITRIPWVDDKLESPETVSRQTVTVSENGTIELPFTWAAPRDAYTVYLTNPTDDPGAPDVGPNLLANPSFENDGNDGTQTPAGWKEDLDLDTSFTEGQVGDVRPRSGYSRLTQAGSGHHEIFTYQDLEVPNGTYQATAWVTRGGGQLRSYIEAKDYGGPTVRTDVPVGTNWQKITIDDIKVTNGRLTVGVATAGEAGQWMSIDDFEVRRVS
ncbi:GH39 family glycosyl hydrolase [Streptomyces sp. AHA2]|uniref:GH39 family glycosyl hydrolase n=1 Tax=Streptomyces sp. AHA2 TaxID=3064526 RepID=UPI002FE1DE30